MPSAAPEPRTRPAGTDLRLLVPLRPLGIGEILDGAVTYIRRYPRPTLGIAAGVALVPIIHDVDESLREIESMNTRALLAVPVATMK